MFRLIEVKNFKSLKDITFSLSNTKTRINKLITVYGENGSGKTNIVEVFKFLHQCCMGKIMDKTVAGTKQKFMKIVQDLENGSSMNMSKMFKSYLEFKDYRMLDEVEPTEIKYCFEVEGKKASYYVKFTDEILEEKLYCLAEKQCAYMFDITKKNNKIIKHFNKSLFTNPKYESELSEEIDKFWGKYSFLSLIAFEMWEKNMQYIYNNMNENVAQAIEYISNITVLVDKADTLSLTNKRFEMKKGKIKKEDLHKLERTEYILNLFFTQGYADIKGVHYNTKQEEDGIAYELFFDKLIGGEMKAIPGDFESAGTKRLLKQFAILIRALMGEIVVLDEMDNGIHDVLMKNIIMSIKDEIKGQLIITTHNTLLLEVLPKENLYILESDYLGNKSINSIKEYDIRIQKNHNIRDLYFKGLFGGIPTTGYIDFEEIKCTLGKEKVKNEKA